MSRTFCVNLRTNSNISCTYRQHVDAMVMKDELLPVLLLLRFLPAPLVSTKSPGYAKTRISKSRIGLGLSLGISRTSTGLCKATSVGT